MEHDASIPSTHIQDSADLQTANTDEDLKTANTDEDLTTSNTGEIIGSGQVEDVVGNEEDTAIFEMNEQEDLESDMEVKAVSQEANFGSEICDDDTQVIKKEYRLQGVDLNNESEIPSTVGSTVSHEKYDNLLQVEKVQDGSITDDGYATTGGEEGKINTKESSLKSSDTQNAYVDIPLKSHQVDVENILSDSKEVDQHLDSNKELLDRSDTNKSHIDQNVVNRLVSNDSASERVQMPEHVLDSGLKRNVSDTSSRSLRGILSEKSAQEGNVEQMQDVLGTNPLIEKHLDERNSNIQCKVINVFINWKDSTTGDETVFEWIHQNCADCRDKYNDWKNHVLEKHKIGLERGIKVFKSKGDMDSLSTDTQKRAKTIVKTEVIDEDDMPAMGSHLTVSIPRLTLKSTTAKTQKRRRKLQKTTTKNSPPKVAKQRAPKVAKRDQTPKIKIKLEEYDSDDYDADIFESEEMEVPKISLPNKRKRGQPRKLIERPMAAPPTFKSDTEDSEKEDPDYQPDDPAYQKVGQKKGRPGRPRKFPVTPPKSYECSHEDCNMTFTKLRERKKHEREAHVVEFKCKIEGCEMVFKTAFKRNKHEVDKHGGFFECEHCDLTFTSRKERTAHVKTHVSFKCEFENCGKSYAMEDYLKVHQKTHFAEKSHVCPICTKGFISIRYLNRHMKIHTERSHQCENCPKSFKTKAALEKHRRRHTGEGLLVCQFCGKKLNGIVSLQRHERVHTGDKPFECKYCDKRFVCQGSLQSHEQEHTGLQWICEKCGKKFKTKGNLQEHERIHTGEKPCKCQFCGKAYAAGSSLWKHVTSRHSGYKRYKCDVCGKLFARYNGLSKHKTVHTGIRNYECKYCHKMFTTSSIRRGHYKQVHLGIKRTGHQGRAKKMKEEAKRLAALKGEVGDQKLFIDDSKEKEPVQDVKMSVDQSGTSSSDTGQTTSSKAAPTQGSPPTSRRIPGVHQLIPIDFSRDRRPGMLPHVLPPDPSRSDFYTMVDSLIQFSKEH